MKCWAAAAAGAAVTIVAWGLDPAHAAAAEIYSAATTNNQGTSFTLVVQKNGTRLTFDITAEGGSSMVNGIPYCDPAELKPDGSFLTYCKKFIPGASVQLAGTLEQATMSPIYGLGGAVFKFQPGPLKKR
ncbi:hypothetical protein SAMN02745126_05468 [Enhydrobacter aerosaccus]|uniref:Uncharacterized protein n=1 Tax=Enhydrobacter aerosaccus TaxID=225324 RepID=A0A1T4T1M8_9HYPH|nr:hypothetical protein [Enhydrobacter aerosaccus]SKA34068.1 hypothetical protein SAMN02745126_05468 [Enhydrobacter aerosaccus]